MQATERKGLVFPGFADVRVMEITAGAETPHGHLYTEAQVFTPDSKRFVFARLRFTGTGWAGRQYAPAGLMLCDVENGYQTRILTDEASASAAAVSPDGKYLYYTVSEGFPGQSKLFFKRISLESGQAEVVLCVDVPLSGCKAVPFVTYPIGAVSADSKTFAVPAFLGDGKTEGAPFGILVFDVDKAEERVIWADKTLFNAHVQYCRKEGSFRDLLVQQNHGGTTDEKGGIVRLTGGMGADLHVIADDGSDLRDLPFGRDGQEFCQGHQCWRGATDFVVTSTVSAEPSGGRSYRLFEAQAAKKRSADRHKGRRLPHTRAELSRFTEKPEFMHFSFDASGDFFVSDCRPYGNNGQNKNDGYIVLGSYHQNGESHISAVPVIRPQSSWSKLAHPHPFFSPDGKKVFFNSDCFGELQIYAAEIGGTGVFETEEKP